MHVLPVEAAGYLSKGIAQLSRSPSRAPDISASVLSVGSRSLETPSPMTHHELHV